MVLHNSIFFFTMDIILILKRGFTISIRATMALKSASS